MSSAEEEKNVNQLLLEFTTMETESRMQFLQRLLTHITPAEKDLIIRSTGAATHPQLQAPHAMNTVVTSLGPAIVAPGPSGDTLILNNNQTMPEFQGQPTVFPVYQLPELMPTIKIEPQIKQMENGKQFIFGYILTCPCVLFIIYQICAPKSAYLDLGSNPCQWCPKH